MKVIVTGFNPFGEFRVNPSQEAVYELPDIVKLGQDALEVRVVKLTLPTCCQDAFDLLSKEVESVLDQPFAIVLSGLADSRDKICLERFALNVRHFRIPDNSGHKWDEEHIHEGAPDALRTRLPLRDIYSHLDAAGFACDISNHAGTYVCNETYYRSLFAWQEHPHCRGIVFVHLPPYESYQHTDPELVDDRPPREIYALALQEIAVFLLGRQLCS